MKITAVVFTVVIALIFSGQYMWLTFAETNDNAGEQNIPVQESVPEETTEVPAVPEYEILDGLYKVKDGVLLEYLGDRGDQTITSLVIPASISRINENVFAECTYIQQVGFADYSALLSIGNYAFKNCKSLASITLPTGLETIGYKAFGGCAALKTLTIPSTVKSGNMILGTDSAVKTVKFEEGISSIPEKFLQYAYSVQKVSIGAGVTTIGSKAFFHCTALKKITLPAGIKKINASAFSGCTALKSCTIPQGIETIGKSAFQNCTALESLVLRKSLKSIGKNAFLNDTNIVLGVYANSVGKKYARLNQIKWEFTSSEVKRRKKNQEIYERFVGLVGKAGQNQYKLKFLNKYVPQGLCSIGKYVVASMYSADKKKCSILVLYHYKTGKYVKKIVLPSVDHVGSMANVKGRLVIGLNNISLTDYVAVINYSKLKKAKNGKKIKYSYQRKIAGYADFAGYDGKIYWAGHCAETENPLMYGYRIKVKKKKLVFTKKYSYKVPTNTQGVVIKKGKGNNRNFIFTTSYGRLVNSNVYTYKVNLKTMNTLGKANLKRILPAMAEGICRVKDKILFLFESAAGLYCKDPDNSSEIQIDNVCKMKMAKLSKLMSS